MTDTETKWTERVRAWRSSVSAARAPSFRGAVVGFNLPGHDGHGDEVDGAGAGMARERPDGAGVCRGARVQAVHADLLGKPAPAFVADGGWERGERSATRSNGAGRWEGGGRASRGNGGGRGGHGSDRRPPGLRPRTAA